MAKERPSYKKLHLLVPLQERTVMALRLATATNLAMPAQKWNQELASQLIILPVAGVLIQSFVRSPDQVSKKWSDYHTLWYFCPHKLYIVGAKLSHK